MHTLLTHTRAFVASRLFKVLLIGGVGVIIQTAIFEVLGIWLELVSPSTAAVLGGEVAILCNFVLNNRYSFGDRQEGALPWRLLKFHTVVAGSLFIQWLFVLLTERATSDLLLIHASYLTGIGVGFFVNYAGYQLLVWRK